MMLRLRSGGAPPRDLERRYALECQVFLLMRIGGVVDMRFEDNKPKTVLRQVSCSEKMIWNLACWKAPKESERVWC